MVRKKFKVGILHDDNGKAKLEGFYVFACL